MKDIRAIPTKEGLVVTFNKHQLSSLKTGGTLVLSLVTGGQRVKMQFMRDTTFKQNEKRLQVIAEDTMKQEQELKTDIEGLANELVE